jgi:hypothetical protein
MSLTSRAAVATCTAVNFVPYESDSINRLVFVMETRCVYCEVGTEF